MYLLEKTLKFKLRDCSIKRMLRSGFRHEFWPFNLFDYIVELGKTRWGGRRERGRGGEEMLHM